LNTGIVVISLLISSGVLLEDEEDDGGSDSVIIGIGKGGARRSATVDGTSSIGNSTLSFDLELRCGDDRMITRVVVVTAAPPCMLTGLVRGGSFVASS